jgi:hypothetical protein
VVRCSVLYRLFVSATGLDAEKLDLLRRWGGGLEADGPEEVAAAGRAILLLIEEIERLHVALWEKQLYPGTARDSDIEAHLARPALLESFSGGLRRRA